MLTVEQALISQAPALAAIKVEHSEKQAIDFLRAMIVSLMKHVNVETGFSAEQVDVLARDVLAEYYYLNVDDIALFFRRIRTGFYGDFYNSLSMEKVHIWLRGYADERMSVAERRSFAKHNENKEGQRK